MIPTEAITALEKALEAGPTPGAWRTDPDYSADVQTADGRLDLCTAEAVGYQVGKGYNSPSTVREAHANAAFIAAANPLAIRTLLDAHAGALRDAAQLRVALVNAELALFHGANMLNAICETDETVDRRRVANKLAEEANAARAALATNTKGAAE